MKVTDRDREIMRFINEFGFCEIGQIGKKFNLKKQRSYQVMSRLVDADLVVHEMVFHGKHGVFYLTRRGAQYTDLPCIRNIPKDNYEHQLTIINVYFQLMMQYPKASWIGERRIKQEKFMKNGFGKKSDHLADGILVLSDEIQIAIEVELTMKSKKRLADIIRGYWRYHHIKEVWYFCSPDIFDRVKNIAERDVHVKVHCLG